jgi:hypothetical protein
LNNKIPVNYSKVVYVNNVNPNSATIFDLNNPPVTNDNALKSDVANLYVGTDASGWVYNSTALNYVTKTSPSASSIFYNSGSTIPAGNTTASIYRPGNLALGADSATRKLDVFGDGRFTSFLVIGSDTTTNYKFLTITPSSTSATVSMQTSKAGTGVDNLVINPSGGNVGIGANPTSVVGDRLQVSGNITANAIDTSTTKIIITTAVSITTATTDARGIRQDGRHVVIDNGVNVINLSCNGGVTSSYGKTGTGAITFVQGSGRTLVLLSGTAVFNGIAGSTATLWSNGTTDYLSINNY